MEFPSDQCNGLDAQLGLKTPALQSTENPKNVVDLKRKSDGDTAGCEESQLETEEDDRKKRLKKRSDDTRLVKKTRNVTTFFEKRKNERRAGIKPSNEGIPKNRIAIAIRANWDREDYKQALENLSTEKPTAEQIAKLEKAKNSGPNYLGRTASRRSGYRFETWKSSTNGYTSQKLLMPAADTRVGEGMHTTLYEMTQGETRYMLSQHLMWNDVAGDEFLSYSIDPLFLVVHALNRYNENQGQVTIQFLDRRKVKNVNRELAAFYPALELYEAFDVASWRADNSYTRIKLRTRKFTQEYLSHHTLRIKDRRFRQVLVETLINDGLYDIFPAFEIPGDHKHAGLYTSQVILRGIGYPPSKAQTQHSKVIYSYTACSRELPFTTEFLEKVQKLTRNFMVIPKHEDPKTYEPHLHIFLSFLTFEKRPSRDPVFLHWMKEHYKAEDVTDLYNSDLGDVRPGFTHVAENLPGVMQYLDLIRDANFAFNLPDIPSNDVETKNALTDEIYAVEDAKHNQNKSYSTKYDRDAHMEQRERDARRRKDKKERKKVKTSNVPSLTLKRKLELKDHGENNEELVATITENTGQESTPASAVEYENEDLFGSAGDLGTATEGPDNSENSEVHGDFLYGDMAT